MIAGENKALLSLTGELTLNALSDKQFPAIKDYQHIKKIDLQQLKNIDSAGLAYLAQIKSHYPALCFVGGESKTHILAELYGLGFIFNA